MNITILDKNAGRRYTDAKVFTWKLYVKEFNKRILIKYCIGVIFLVIGIITFNDTVWRSHIGNSIKYENFHFMFTLGLVWLYVTVIGHFGVSREKEKYMKKIYNNAVAHFSRSNNVNIEINDNGILYNSAEVRMEIGWPVITHFKTVEPYIFLVPNEDFHSAIVVDKRLVSTSESEQLIGFLKTSKKEMSKLL